MSKQATWTGERLETFVFNENTIEHLHRYAIAMEFAAGKRVLDIACGEGYGSNLLAQKAAHVTGVDIDNTTIDNAIRKYSQPNLHFLPGKAEKIPAEDDSFDLVVSFETIEHLEDHEAMMKEIKRVMHRGGVLLFSTPDKAVYSDRTSNKNPFHIKELYKDELDKLLKSHFINVALYSQQMVHASFIHSTTPLVTNTYTGNFEKITKDQPQESIYIIALAADTALPQLNNSLFNGHSIIEQALTEREKILTGTITYRLGHFLLYPIKLIRRLFRK